LIEGANTIWFADSEVIDTSKNAYLPLSAALPVVRGLTVLEGESGLGKTMYLLRLTANRSRIVAYIRAAEAAGDVLKAIRARMPAEIVRDESFLRSLIHSGGLDICIDGLNEVPLKPALRYLHLPRKWPERISSCQRSTPDGTCQQGLGICNC